jgi:hypothetical protein
MMERVKLRLYWQLHLPQMLSLALHLAQLQSALISRLMTSLHR